MCRQISVYSLLECMAIVDIGGRREGDLVRFRCAEQYFGVWPRGLNGAHGIRVIACVYDSTTVIKIGHS